MAVVIMASTSAADADPMVAPSATTIASVRMHPSPCPAMAPALYQIRESRQDVFDAGTVHSAVERRGPFDYGDGERRGRPDYDEASRQAGRPMSSTSASRAATPMLLHCAECATP
jgi:hypothetical protein